MKTLRFDGTAGFSLNNFNPLVEKEEEKNMSGLGLHQTDGGKITWRRANAL